MSLSEIAEDVNEKHVVAWGDACLRDGINNTPLTPVVTEVLISAEHVHTSICIIIISRVCAWILN